MNKRVRVEDILKSYVSGLEKVSDIAGAIRGSKDSKEAARREVYRAKRLVTRLVKEAQVFLHAYDLTDDKADYVHIAKNKLATVFGYCSTKWLRSNPTVFYDNIEHAIEAIHRLTLEVRSVEASKRSPKFEPFNLDQLVQQIGPLYSRMNLVYGVNILFDGQATWAIKGDQGRIVGAIDNLVVNAQQAMPGGGNIWVSTYNSSFGGRDFATIKVKDDGPGIADVNLAISNYYTSKKNGNGKGLPSVLRTIEMHKGKLVVDSKLGQGTSFELCFPIFARQGYKL